MARSNMDTESITIVTRDWSGRRETLQYENVYVFQNREDELLSRKMDGRDRILLVLWGDSCIFSRLNANTDLPWRDLARFFE